MAPKFICFSGWNNSLLSTQHSNDTDFYLGISPNAQLAESAGLHKSCENGGLIANEQLETNKKNIFVAGDVASYYDPLLRKQKRIEHHDNAFVMGKLAGQNKTGE